MGMAGAFSPQLHLVEAQPATDPIGDSELVARAQGDSEAFAALYRRYIEPVYCYCYHRLSSHAAAEDATSDIFLKAFSGIRGYRNERSFRSWLFAIAHNTVTDSYRAHHPQEPIEAAARVFDPAPSPEDRAEVADGERSVRTLLKQVTPQQARILELRLAGLTGPEIAHVLDCSLASVKIGQVRGYGRLREILGGPVGKEGGGHD
jgi:RNA polymerase sigma-70 factor, ECF subfamily